MVLLLKIMKMQMFIFMFAVTNIPSLEGGSYVHDQEWFKRKSDEAYNASLKSYHHEPIEVVNDFNHHVHRALDGQNSTRRGLGRKYHGECKAQNPIDRCWRCDDNWAKNRKKLAKCVKGFGRNATGGVDGEFYVVTDPSDNDVVTPKPGTLRFAVLQPRPLWIIFDKDMRIKLQNELMVTSNKTIDGRGHTIQICEGAGITVQFAKNVIIHNLKIHDIAPGKGGMMRDTAEHVGIRGTDDGDCIGLFAASDVWIDHISMWNCRDGMIDIVKGSTGITISNVHLTKHDHVFLFGASDSDPNDSIMQITLAFNHFGKGLIQRMPRCRYGFFHVVNNDYTHWLMYAVGGSSHPTIISEGNRYIAPPDPNAKLITHRNFASEEEWKKWQWRSEDDVFIDGAYFVESGEPFKEKQTPFSNKAFIQSKLGSYVRRLTRFSGFVKCIEGTKC